MKRIISPVLAIGVVLMTLTACAGNTAGSTKQTLTTKQDFSNEEYIFVGNMGNLEYFNAVKYGWSWAGDVLGVKATYVGPAENDVNAQVAAFEQAIAKQPAGIAVFASDPVLTPVINKAIAAGIPVVTAIGDQPDSKRISYVGSNQYDIGYMGGMKLGEALGGKGQVAILSLPGIAMFDERVQGFRAAFATFPGIKVVQEGDTKADTVTAVNVAKDIMQRYPDLAAFACTDSTGGMGAGTAVKEAGVTGHIRVISMDRNSDVLSMIQDGTITGTIAQEDVGNSYWALQALFTYVHHQSPLTTDNKAAGVTTGPSIIQTHVNYIDKSNVQYFIDANARFAK